MNDNNTIPTVAERLRWLGQIARRHWIVLVSVTAVATVAALFVGARGTREYSAPAKLVLDDTQLVGVTSSTPLVPNPDPERDVNTKVALIRTAPVAAAVDSRLHLGVPVSALLSKVQAQTESTSNIVDVTATDTDPARATAIANGFAQEY